MDYEEPPMDFFDDFWDNWYDETPVDETPIYETPVKETPVPVTYAHETPSG
jgi:hypothetical protein